MGDKIELNWTLNVSYAFRKHDVFEALLSLCTYYIDIPKEYDYAEFIIHWLRENLINYTNDLLSILKLSLDNKCNIDGELTSDNITELLDNKEFMKEFKDFLNDD